MKMLTDDERTDDGVTGILLAHKWAFGSGVLKRPLFLFYHPKESQNEMRAQLAHWFLRSIWEKNGQLANTDAKVIGILLTPLPCSSPMTHWSIRTHRLRDKCCSFSNRMHRL